MSRLKRNVNSGFTLVEMMVVAPIVILFIGGFIALIVNLTAETMASRSANLLTYNIQDALSRIEQDVKLSSTFLAENSVSVASTGQGYGGSTTAGSTTNFSNINRTSAGGSPQSIILNSIATTRNPLSENTSFIYLKDQPNSCALESEYRRNRPLVYNIVYFIDSSNTLWRRTIMPSDYADANKRCGSMAPWQIPSCNVGYTSARTFCKTSDEKLVSGVTPSDFIVNYYSSASTETPNTSTTNASATVQSRNSALLGTPTIGVSITARQTIAGRDIKHTSSIRVTRLDTNATAIAPITAPTSAPTAPTVTSKISNGSNVVFSWQQVNGATRYTADYRIKKGTTWGSWVTGPTNITNANRTYTVTAANHNETVEIRVRAANDIGTSAYTNYTTIIPLWSPINLANKWTDYSGSSSTGYQSAGFTKTSSGLVLLKGLVNTSETLSGEQVLGYLPEGYRPTGRIIFSSLASGNAAARVDVLPSGEVVLFAGVTPGWVSLETVRFLPSSAPYTRVAPTLQNSWVNFGGSYATASYTKDGIGRAVIQGLIKSGSTAANSAMFTLPAAYMPTHFHNMATRTNAFAGIGITTTPSVVAKLPITNTYYSLNTIYLPSAVSTTWTNLTLQNSWVSYGGTYAAPSYTKTSDGVVHLRGLMKSGTVTQSGWTVLSNLPAGFRPKNRMIFTGYGTDAQSRIDVLAGGNIEIQGTTLNSWQSLDGIMFVAEQ